MPLVLLLATATASQAQPYWPATFTPTPATASTRGGTIIVARVSTVYLSNVTATVDGQATPIVHASSTSYWLVAPPHAAGPATVRLANTGGATAESSTATITYVEMPQVGLASPVTVVSRASDGSQSTGRSNRRGSVARGSSANGRFVLFRSDSGFAGLPGGTTDDLYRKDLETGELVRVLACGLECYSASISADGGRVSAQYMGYDYRTRLVAVDATFTNPPSQVDVDTAGNAPTTGSPGAGSLSGNGQFIAFTTSSNLDAASGDVANTNDLFVRDLQTSLTERWTTAANVGVAGISADGRLVALSTTTALLPDDTNGVSDVYLLDRQGGAFSRPLANTPVSVGLLSADGTVLAFTTAAANLVPDDTNQVPDAFVMDLATSIVSRVSLSTGGEQLSLGSSVASISANGQRVVFTSSAPELTAAPLPTGTGIFVHDRVSGTTTLVSADQHGWASVGASGAAITADGRGLTFGSLNQDLVPDDTNLALDVFRKELPADTPAGSDVDTVPVDPTTGETPVALTFATITIPGDTSVTYTETAPPLPAGFQIGSRYVDISTTAVFSGAITVCVDYDPATTPDPGVLQLLHYEGGAWVNITTGFDPVAHVVCGSTTSLSPFVLAIPPQVTYTVRSLLDADRVFKAGSTIPIRLQVFEGGANVSAADLPLVATGVRMVSTQTDWATPEDPGQSNPDRTFQFTEVEGEPGYRFNLKTTGLTAGTYELQFRVATEGPLLAVEFQVR
jgi:Tol biopolymer transport system component